MSDHSLPSISNNQLKRIRKLHRKKYRYEQEEFLLEGPRAVEQLVNNRVLTVNLLIFDKDARLWEQAPWEIFLQYIEGCLVESDIFDEISDTDNPQGVSALVDLPDEETISSLKRKEGVILAFDAIQDPGNVGTMVRSATWFGCTGLLVGKGTVDLFHPKVVRSTAGTTGVLPYQSGELSILLEEYKEAGWRVLILHPIDTAIPLADVNQSSATIIVAGNEAHGISSSVKNQADDAVIISSRREGERHLESLNVAVTVGISLYELMKD